MPQKIRKVFTKQCIFGISKEENYINFSLIMNNIRNRKRKEI